MENNKQTAVEWLEKELEGFCVYRNLTYTQGQELIKTLKQAKEMEKQQQDILNECEIQLEYLNQKFGETGTTNALLSKLKNK